MVGILRAYSRALRSLLLPGVLTHFLWPVLAALALWLVVGVVLWDRLAHALAGIMASGRTAQASVAVTLKIALFFVSIPMAAMTAVLILEVVALPFILDKVANTEYPRLERHHGGSQWQSLRNTLVSFAIAAVLAMASLPLWLVPGAGVVISLALSSWLNYRSFRYDVLMNHADAKELSALPREHRNWLLLMSLGAGALGFVPFVNLLAVPFAGLSFAHYLLHALERLREAATGPSSSST